jgi:hypothetical protein
MMMSKLDIICSLATRQLKGNSTMHYTRAAQFLVWTRYLQLTLESALYLLTTLPANATTS